MTYIEFVGEILKYAGIPALIAIGLKSSFDEKLENLKSDLNHLRSKENFKFTKLHEKRLVVLEKTYHYVYESLDLLKDYVQPLKFIPEGKTFEEGERVLSDKFTDKHLEFNKYFNYNLIYFDESVENLLNNYFDQLEEIFITYYSDQSNLTENPQPEKGFSLNSKQAHTLIHEKLRPLKRQIEINFRKLLGE